MRNRTTCSKPKVPRHSDTADAVTRCESLRTKLLSSPRPDPMSLRAICSAEVYARAEAWLLLSRLLFVPSSSLIIQNCIHWPLLKYNNNNNEDDDHWSVGAKSCSKYLNGFKRGGRFISGQSSRYVCRPDRRFVRAG